MIRAAVLLLAIFAGTLPAQDLAGAYRVRGVPEMASELLLKPDGTFQYALIYGAADYTAEGKWRRDAATLILNTDPPSQPPFRLSHSETVRSPDIKVRVVGPQQTPVGNIDVMLQTTDGEVKGRTDEQGTFTTPERRRPQRLRFHVPVYNVTSEPIAVTETHNRFTIEINGAAITQVPFKDEKLKIDGGALELRYWNPDQPLRYVASHQQ